jgi:hypothetical protein
VTAILPAWEMSWPKAALSPVMGAPMPITTLCPLENVAQPTASVLQTAGAAAAPPQADRIIVAAKTTERMKNRRFMDFSSKGLV